MHECVVKHTTRRDFVIGGHQNHMQMKLKSKSAHERECELWLNIFVFCVCFSADRWWWFALKNVLDIICEQARIHMFSIFLWTYMRTWTKSLFDSYKSSMLCHLHIFLILYVHEKFIFLSLTALCALSSENYMQTFGGKFRKTFRGEKAISIYILCHFSPSVCSTQNWVFTCIKKKKIEGKYFARSALCFRWRTQLTLSRVIFANLRKEEERRGENVFDKSLTRKKRW